MPSIKNVIKYSSVMADCRDNIVTNHEESVLETICEVITNLSNLNEKDISLLKKMSLKGYDENITIEHQ